MQKNIFTTLRRTRAQELYDAGIVLMQTGQLADAVLLFSESSFFAPENANPLAALAECYVFMCDLQSAVRCYRQALWLLQKARRRRAEAKRPPVNSSSASSSAREDEFSSPIHRRATATATTAAGGDADDASAGGPAAIITRSSSGLGGGEGGPLAFPVVGTNGQTEPEAFLDDSSIELKTVRRRLVGLLDALSLAAYRMADFAQALRFVEEAEEVLGESRTNATISLHTCVYLIALGREEQAEFKLEGHMRSFPEHSSTAAALLVQLYCNRQAFRPARMLMESCSPEGAGRDSLTIATHIFHELYGRYRAKALEKKDKGTISKCLEVYPSDDELLFARAKILIAEGQHKRSVKDLFKVIKESNGAHKEAVEMMTSVLFTIGSSLDGEEGLREAVSYYSESLKWRSDNINVLLARADCYVKLQDFEKGLQDYNAIRKLDPNDTVARRRIASLRDMWGRKFYAEGKLAEAEKEFTNAILTDDTVPLFYYHRALCRFDMNEPRFGLRDVLSCQQLRPTDPKLRAFIIRYLGSDEVPDTTKDNQQARLKDLVQYDEKGDPQLNKQHVPQSSAAAAKRAMALFGQPSARIDKELSAAGGGGAATTAHTGATGKGFMTYKDYSLSQPQNARNAVSLEGRRKRVHDRSGLPQPIPKHASTLPSLRQHGNSKPSASNAKKKPTTTPATTASLTADTTVEVADETDFLPPVEDHPQEVAS